MSNRARDAFTLLELLVVMTVGMVVLTLSIGMISQLLRIASIHQNRVEQSRTADRLSREFRRDAHQSISFQLDQDLRLVLPDDSFIVYRSRDHVVHREILRDGTPTASEVFRLGDGQSATFDALPESNRVLLTVQATGPARRTERRVMAVVGRWNTSAPAIEVSP
jgi:type II secretory pathway component PulJ